MLVVHQLLWTFPKQIVIDSVYLVVMLIKQFDMHQLVLLHISRLNLVVSFSDFLLLI